MDRLKIAVIVILSALTGAGVMFVIRAPELPKTFSEWLTPIVAISTIAQALFAYWALNGLQHSRIAARAATDGLAITRETAEQQLRAYVCYGSAKHKPLLLGERAHIEVEFENCGDTPAYDVRCAGATVLRETTKPFEFPPPPPEILNDAGRTTLGPGRTTTLYAWTEEPLSAEELAELECGALVLTVFGLAMYRDVFGRDRHTTFRVECRPMALTQDGRMWLCAEGNLAG